MMNTGGVTFSGGAAGPMMSAAAAPGAPYSAEQISETVQTLADGTHITQPAMKTMYYRDSQGRTRMEHSFPLPPGAVAGTETPSLIEINDPVSGAHYTLEARNKTARKWSMPTAMPVSSPRPPTSGARLGPPANSAAPANAGKPKPEFSYEDLGTQTIEGVVAEGRRTTIAYPVGAFGNDRPITTTHDVWFSNELKAVILSNNTDPRSGESTTKLVNISRAEPDPTLFQIPADYQIVDAEAAAAK
jgi:hypothetical protein